MKKSPAPRGIMIFSFGLPSFGREGFPAYILAHPACRMAEVGREILPAVPDRAKGRDHRDLRTVRFPPLTFALLVPILTIDWQE